MNFARSSNKVSYSVFKRLNLKSKYLITFASTNFAPNQDRVALQRLPQIEGTRAEPVRVATLATAVGTCERSSKTVSIPANANVF